MSFLAIFIVEFYRMRRTQNLLLQGLMAVGVILFAVYIVVGTSMFARFAEAGGEAAEESKIQESVLTQLGVVQDPRLTEISGIDASYLYPDCFWVHNDSGNPAELFLIDSRGSTKAVVRLSDAKNIDWEDICLFNYAGVPHICVADVGDNSATRKGYQLYVFAEPKIEIPDQKESPVNIKISEITRLDFQYADGPRNCEAIAVHPKRGEFFLFQKSKQRNSQEKEFGIYKLRLKKNYKLESNVARKIGQVKDRLVTGAAISRDSRQLIFCNYVSAALMNRPPAMDWEHYLPEKKFTRLALPVQRQGEAICFSADGKSIVVASEKVKQPIWKIALPESN